MMPVEGKKRWSQQFPLVLKEGKEISDLVRICETNGAEFVVGGVATCLEAVRCGTKQ